MEKSKILLKSAALGNITTENVQAQFELNFKKWQALNSDTIKNNGENINAMELSFLMFAFSHAKDGEDALSNIEFDCKKGGIILTKEDFIKDEVNMYAPYQKHLLSLPKNQISEAENSFLNRLGIYLEYLDSFNKKPEQDKKEPEQLSELITHKKSVQIVEAIKGQYKNIGGKRLKLLLIALQKLGLLPAERIASKFHTLCRNEFDWDIKSYEAMNNYKFNDQTDTVELNGMRSFISKHTTDN